MLYIQFNNKYINFLIILLSLLLLLSFASINNDNFYTLNDNTSNITPKIENKSTSHKELIKNFIKQNFFVNSKKALTAFKVKDTIQNYIIETTIDSLLQYYANLIITRYKPLYGAIVVIDANNGEIKAISNYTNADTLLPINDSLLFINPNFPAASTFKTITLYSAIENNIANLNTEFTFSGRSTTLYRYQLKNNINKWSRTFSLEKAFAQSCNPIFGKLGIILGEERIYTTSKKFLFLKQIPFIIPLSTSHLQPIDSTYNLAELGSGFNKQTTISPLHGSLIFAPIANKNYIPRPILFKKITKNNKLIYNGTDSIKPLIYLNPKYLNEIEKASISVIKYGTASHKTQRLKYYLTYKDTNWIFGGKTGSVDSPYFNGRTDWFIGFIRNKHTKEAYSIAVVQIHGLLWYKHSSFIASELLKWYIRDKKRNEAVSIAKK